MECLFLFVLLIAIAVIYWHIQLEIQGNLDNKISKALDSGDINEFLRLSAIRDKRVARTRQAHIISQQDQNYLDAFMVLDAAENGVFLPDGQEVFDRIDNYGYEDEYYDDDDRYDESEWSDHWGPV